jgi:hypothetical protein
MELKDPTVFGGRVDKLAEEHLLLTAFSSSKQKKCIDILRIREIFVI